MKKNIRINNIPFNSVIVSEEGKNIIYAKSCNEEFFGVYNIKVGDKDILCESNSPDRIYCEIILDGKVYENVPFEIVKSQNSRIIVNKNSVDKNIMNEEALQNEILKLKREIREVSKQKTLLNESVENNYKEDLLSEFFKVVNENEYLIDNKFTLLKEELENRLNELSVAGFDYLKKENSESVRNIVNEFYQEISDSNRKKIDEFKNILKKETSLLEEKHDSKLNGQVEIYSKITSKLIDDLETSKKETESLFNQKINDSEKIYSEANSKLIESFINIKEDSQKSLKENVDKSKETLMEVFEISLENHKKELSENFISKFEETIKKRESEINNKTKNILDEHNKSVISFLDSKRKEITDSSQNLLEESNKKIKELTKKVDDLNNQLNKSNKEKTKIDNLLQESRKYTDKKILQALEESKRFTRIMMDMVGGGSGSVAVQYAAGGNINGDLTINGTLSSGNIDVGNLEFNSGSIDGDLNVAGIISANAILSGGRDLRDIFAGEGTGDTNILGGGQF